MFSRFSPASRRVLRAAEQECRNRNHYYVGVEHLLIALLEERDPTLDARLGELGVRLSDLHAALRGPMGTGEDRLWDGILLTPRVRAVVELAGKTAGSGLVEPVQLLNAIITEGGGVAAEILRQVGASDESRERSSSGSGYGVTAWST